MLSMMAFTMDKPITASAVFPGSRFINFIKFIPEIRYICLRDRSPCVKHTDLHTVTLILQLDLDFFLSLQMVQGIAYIVCHNLFDLKLIGPYINRLLRSKITFAFFCPIMIFMV